MRFVAVKTEEQRSTLAIHRVRETLVTQKIQLINALRAHLAEFGIVGPQGAGKVAALTAVLADLEDTRVPALARGALQGLAVEHVREALMIADPRNSSAPDEAVYAHLAKAIVLHCMRNTGLEELHAGVYPDSATGEYTDVKVVSPYGEIPWNKVSRISGAEMRSLMRQCVNRVYTYLLHLETSRGFKIDRRWDPPELDPKMMEDIEAIKAEDVITILRTSR